MLEVGMPMLVTEVEGLDLARKVGTKVVEGEQGSKKNQYMKQQQITNFGLNKLSFCIFEFPRYCMTIVGHLYLYSKFVCCIIGVPFTSHGKMSECGAEKPIS
jgi:hypothetical protein